MSLSDTISSDAIVIGSGFGGAIAALRLSEAGIKTIVLERGRRWPSNNGANPFSTFRTPDGRAGWFSDSEPFGTPTNTPGRGAPQPQSHRPIDKFPGMVEVTVGENITVWSSAGVGGGSLVYNTCFQKPTEDNFQRAFNGYDVSLSDLDDYYDKVKDVMKPKKIPSSILNTEYYLSSKSFKKEGKKAGLETDDIEMAIDWDSIEDEIKGKKAPSALIGEMWYGMNGGAKNSLDKNYLKDAEESSYVEVKELHQVIDITAKQGGGYKLKVHKLNEENEDYEELNFECEHLFMGAGSIGTTKLLVQAKHTGGLPDLNDEVGKHWSQNGDTFANRKVEANTKSAQGGPASSTIHDKNEGEPFGPTTLVVYPVWYQEDIRILNTLGMGIPSDPAPGYFSYNEDSGSVDLFYPSDGYEEVVQAAHATYKKLDDANNGPDCEHPDYYGMLHCKKNLKTSRKKEKGLQLAFGISPHPLGGCVMGKACDYYGNVKGYPGLYVVDSAFIPGSTAACTPAWTIAAFAERNMDNIIKGIKPDND